MPEKAEKPSQNPLSDWLRLQLEFQGRLADETLRYLRRLQGAAAPVTPGTVLLPEAGTELHAETVSGGSFEVTLEVENLQRVHSIAAPVLDPLVSASGTTWYPEADFTPSFSLVAPDERIKFLVCVSVPQVLPPGTYVGALSLRGLRQMAFLLTVVVNPPHSGSTKVNAGTQPSRKQAGPVAAKKSRSKSKKP
jgi:hypothetical protein